MAIVPVEMQGGLNLVTSKVIAPNGTLRQSKNIEVGTKKGYRRIDGFERTDGRQSGHVTRFHEFTTSDTPSGTGADRFFFGQSVSWDGGAGIWIYHEVGGSASYDNYVIVTSGNAPEDGDTFTHGGNTLAVDADASLVTIDSANFTAQYANIQSARSGADVVTESPGHGAPLAGIYHENEYYVIADVVAIAFTSGGTTEPKFADHLQVRINGTGSGHVYSDYLVLQVDVDSGSWGAGTAAGTIHLCPIYESENGFADATSIGNGFGDVRLLSTESGTINDPFTISLASANAVSSNSASTIGSWLFRANYRRVNSLQAGWRMVRPGFKVAFDQGQNEPNFLSYSDILSVSEYETVDTGSMSFLGMSGSSWSNISDAKVNDANAASYALVFTGSVYESSPIICNPNLTLAPFITEILGFSLSVDARQTSGSGTSYADVTFSSSADKASGETLTATRAVTTFGGASDTWGMSQSDLIDALQGGHTFSFEFNNASPTTVEVYYVSFRIYFKGPGGCVYLWDSANSENVSIIYPLSLSLRGNTSFSGNDAEGTVVYYDLLRQIDPEQASSGDFAKVLLFSDGLVARSAIDGGGNIHFVLDGEQSMALLPARSELDSADSAFELISENFHSRVSGRAIFGVSGAGPAFTSNEYFFSYIYSYVSGIGSEFSTSDDKPRHIEYFQNQLLLGYENGSVLLGSAGDPMGFDASLGSANIPSGSPVTGLLSIKGQDIAVFSRERIQALQFGGAMSVQNLKTISHNTGAIEYTVRDLGGIPVFLDFRGINTLQNVEAYGDFNRGRLTEMVAPYFVERIQDQPLTDSEPVNVAGVCVVRAKNQYRVFFKDGNTLTMTLRDAQGAPEFTTQFYAIDSATEAAGMAFRHFSEGISDSGRDRVFMVTDDSRYVYELERGISFDGYAIAWSFELNPLFIDGPHVHKEFSRAHLGGEFYTHNTLDVTLGKNNTPPNYPTDSRTLDFGDLPDFSEGTYQIYEAKFPLHGYGQRLRFHGSSAVQFPFLLQSLTLFTTDTKLTG